MSLVQLLESKWYFILIDTHVGPGDDPTGEQN